MSPETQTSQTKYKETPIGKIPKEWKFIELNDYIELETGKRAKGGALKEGKIASIGGEHIGKSGNIILKDMKYIPQNFYLNLTKGKVKVNDILVVKDGATTGKTALVKELPYSQTAVNEHVFIVRIKSKKLSNRFLFFVLLSKIGQTQIKRRFHGIIGGIKQSEFKSVEIPLPPLSEQEEIAEILSTVDDSIKKVDDVIAKTERLKRGLMQELLKRGIGHDEFKETPIGKIPKEWEVARLEDISTEVYRYPTYYNIDYVEKGVPEIRGELLSDNGKIKKDFRYISAETSQKFPRTVLEAGDLVISVRGTMGKVGYITSDLESGNITANLMRISPDREKIYPNWLKHLLLSSVFQSQLKRYSTSTTIKTIKSNRLKSIRLPHPPLPEQKRVNEIISTVNEKLELEKKRKEKLERIKEGLMQDLLTGGKRVGVEA